MPRNEDPKTVIPAECPRCGKTLYSSSRLRPAPGLSIRGKLLMAVGVLTSAALFIGLGILIRAIGETNGLRIPGKILGPVLMVPSIVPGLAIGLLAHRLAKVRRVRCWNCKWSAVFGAEARWAPSAPAVGIAIARPVGRAPGGQASEGASAALEQIVDDSDPWEECAAWAYAEIRRGRTPEDVQMDLTAAGWPEDDVVGMVERCRREARHQPGGVRAAQSAGGANPLPENFTGTEAAQLRGRYNA